MKNRKRIAVVTGGAGALGMATGMTLASRGFITYLFDVDKVHAQAAAESLALDGHVVYGRQVDVTDAKAVRQAVELIGGTYSR